ncbi:guanylate kinase [Buchnera aphidicola (Taiwanaphis decaspermi)]|uniref:guanylate kinase n=1 Tax=Buchnera aphidicola TaxID=9 RepID=UPI0031B898E3
MKKGIIFIISAPSGTGKSTLIKKLLNNNSYLFCDMTISISYTTRIIRPGEHNGIHYHFISKLKFKEMIDNDDFLEYAKVFNNYYGTSKKNINRFISNGINVLLDIDWQGARQIKKKTNNSKSIFILPPSIKELYTRLKNRSQDSDDVINKRMSKAISEINHYSDYDYLIINDNIKIAIDNLKSIIVSSKLKTQYQKYNHNQLLKNLLNNSI